MVGPQRKVSFHLSVKPTSDCHSWPSLGEQSFYRTKNSSRSKILIYVLNQEILLWHLTLKNQIVQKVAGQHLLSNICRPTLSNILSNPNTRNLSANPFPSQSSHVRDPRTSEDSRGCTCPETCHWICCKSASWDLGGPSQPKILLRHRVPRLVLYPAKVRTSFRLRKSWVARFFPSGVCSFLRKQKFAPGKSCLWPRKVWAHTGQSKGIESAPHFLNSLVNCLFSKTFCSTGTRHYF
jgi:hypothetical protein